MVVFLVACAVLFVTMLLIVAAGVVWRWNVMDNRLVWLWCDLLILAEMGVAVMLAAWMAPGGTPWIIGALVGAVSCAGLSAAWVWVVSTRLRRAMVARWRNGLVLPKGIRAEDVAAWSQSHPDRDAAGTL